MSIELADDFFLLSAVFDLDFFVVHVTACFCRSWCNLSVEGDRTLDFGTFGSFSCCKLSVEGDKTPDFGTFPDFHGVTCATRKSMSIELADDFFLVEPLL